MNSPSKRLRHRIQRDGPLSFAEFMEEALYGEGGYYRTAQPRIGPAGDFVTGSSLSPLFGRSTARLLARLAVRLGGAVDLLEAGYGDGSHLAAVVAAAPARALSRVLGWDRVQRSLPLGVTAVDGLADLADAPVRGLVFSYELFDALPVHRLVKGDEHEWRELGVGLDDDEGFRWQELAADRTDLAELLGEDAATVERGQIVDLAPGWRPLYRRLAATLERGLLVTCDYGFERHRLLDPRVRRHGTLACYRHHRVHRDPFVDVGRQDLTAHVDFTALILEGEAAGLETVALVRQAEWLGACGVFAGLETADPATRLEAAQLMNLDGMGSEIKVLVQARGIDCEGLFDLELKLAKGC
ncbi:MAG: SAM-dependent methyltransferase [Acidobacteria bacterium]|nr:SAM-dependent methyltransferase [Acidobacteriota bacterium]